MRSALLAADLILIPVQPSPLDGWASAEMLALLSEARIYRPQLAARFVLNRCGARTVIARETAETLADHDPPVLASAIGQRVVFADAAQTDRGIERGSLALPLRQRRAAAPLPSRRHDGHAPENPAACSPAHAEKDEGRRTLGWARILRASYGFNRAAALARGIKNSAISPITSTRSPG